MASQAAILASIDALDVYVVSAAKQHSGKKINGHFRPSGQDIITSVDFSGRSRLGEICFSVTRTERLLFDHDQNGDVVSVKRQLDEYKVTGIEETLALGLISREYSGIFV